MTDKTQVKVIIKGRVQGVFYRASTKDEADRLGIKGYVKNLPDGAVEAFFESSESRVTKMVEWCHRGPAASQVEHVIVEKAKTAEHFDTFIIRY